MKLPNQRHFYSALTASTLLHTGLLGLLVSASIEKEPTTEVSSPASVTVALQFTNPQKRRAMKSTTRATAEQPLRKVFSPSTPPINNIAPPTTAPEVITSQNMPEESADTAAKSTTTIELPSAADLSHLRQDLQAIEEQRPSLRFDASANCERKLDFSQVIRDCENSEPASTAPQDPVRASFAAVIQQRFKTPQDVIRANEQESKQLRAELERVRLFSLDNPQTQALTGGYYGLLVERYKALNPNEAEIRSIRSGSIPLLGVSPSGISLLGGLLAIDFNHDDQAQPESHGVAEEITPPLLPQPKN